MAMFRATARSFLRTLESMATPSSVNTRGSHRRPPWRLELEVTVRDLKLSASARLSRNAKSSGKRSVFRETAWLRALVVTP
jgi:hypothetical protein